MHRSVEQLLRVQELDSQLIFLRESLRLRPLELEEDRRNVAQAKAALDALVAEIKQTKVDSDRRELDVKKCDTEIEKLKVALNTARSNQEYTIYKEQIQRQEEVRGKAEEEVIGKLTSIDQMELTRKELAARLAEAEKSYRKKEAEVAELVQGMQSQVAELEAKRGGLLADIEPEHLNTYERILKRTNNFAIARVVGQVCHGCFMSVTSQEIALLRQSQFLQCKSCVRILYV